MEMQLHKHEAMLLSLLRASLQQETADTTLFESATPDEWKACYKLACSQGVMALAWDAVSTLPAELLPPLGLKISWALIVQQLEKRYVHYCNTILELSQLYAKHGICTMVLKGIGLSTIYPKPQHREGGDIDIYTYSADPSRQSDEAANQLADQLMLDLHKEVEQGNDKHSVFFYRDVPIENHKTFLDVTEWQFAIDAEKDLHRMLNPHAVDLLPNAPQILVPSDDFNTLYLAIHTLRHYCVGMNLHHLCDWACLMNRSGLHLPDDIQDPRYTTLFNLFTSFTNTYLGTHVPVKTDEQALADLFYQMFRCPLGAKYPSKNPVKIFLFRVRRYLRYRSVMKRLIGESFFANTWMLIRSRLHSGKN